MNSFFVERDNEQQSAEFFGRKVRYLKTITQQRIEDIRIVCFPIHRPGHWIAGIVRFDEKQIIVYDSLGGIHNTIYPYIRNVFAKANFDISNFFFFFK